MKEDFRYNRFMLAEGLFALLCVLRFWDRRMLPHSLGLGDGVTLPFLQNYYVMVVATGVYFLGILLFSRWALRRSAIVPPQGNEEQPSPAMVSHRVRQVEYVLSLLALFLFPAYLSEDYFGAADIFAWMLFLGLFILFTTMGLSIGWLAVVFSLLQLPLLRDATTELSFVRFVITAVFFLAVLWYWKQRHRLSPFVFMGLPMGAVWALSGDYGRGLFSLMMGFAFAWLYAMLSGRTDDAVAEASGGEGSPEAQELLPSVVLLLCIALFVIFWMYGEPLLLEEEILDY